MADNNIEINSGNKNKDFYMKIYVHINIKYSYFYDFLCYGLDVIGFWLAYYCPQGSSHYDKCDSHLVVVEHLDVSEIWVQLSCSLAGAPISRRKLPQQQQQRSQQNIRSFQHDPVCLHAPIILIKRNKQVLGSRFWNRFLDQTVPVPEYSSTRHTPS